jgi:ribosomal protein S27E
MTTAIPAYHPLPLLFSNLLICATGRSAWLRRRPSAVPLPEAATACYCEYHQHSRKSNPSGTMDKAVQLAPAGRRVHYERRRPEDTVLYQLVQEHLKTFLVQVELETGAGLSEFVKEEFDAFLQSGILAHGFLRLRCADCAHEKLVAFSCKRRGFCPACGARRMAETAAHLVDDVIPRVPVRQWVLSFPIPLRLLFATHPQLLALVLTIVHRGHCQISDPTSRTPTHRSPYRRRHAHPALRIGRQSEHPSALPRARWGLSQHRGRPGVPPRARPHSGAAPSLTDAYHQAPHVRYLDAQGLPH